MKEPSSTGSEISNSTLKLQLAEHLKW